MNGEFLSKIMKAVEKGDDVFAGAQHLPMPFKLKIIQKIESKENKAAWGIVKRSSTRGSGGPLIMHMLAYIGVLSAEQKMKEAKDEFIKKPSEDIHALKCRVLNCNRAELLELEAYFNRNPKAKHDLINAFRNSFTFLRNVPPFSIYK